MDPDDIIFNQDIFQELYNYYTEFNLDIIEFFVYHQREGRKNIFFPIWLCYFILPASDGAICKADDGIWI